MNKVVFDLFNQICQVPRPSKHEERISQWLMDFAAAHGIECCRDAAMNVFMHVPASPGYEDHEGVILQAHMDMVCEKNGDVQHDFMNDPIQTYIDGNYLKARGTTLGGDDGIGIAMALAVMTDPNSKHPTLEAFFTVDEETGLSGAEALQDGYLKGRRLINLDSEDDGQIFIGCAGGIDTVAKMHYTACSIDNAQNTMFAFKVSVKGLMGGHSGDDINKGRANANKIMANMLSQLIPLNVQLASVNGGNLRNAIAREAEAIFAVPLDKKHDVVALFNGYKVKMEQTYEQVEKKMNLSLDSCAMPDMFIPTKQAHLLIQTLVNCPHGMIAMSRDIEGLVETSTNLASVKMKDGYVEICTSQRSSVENEIKAIQQRVQKVLEVACDEVAASGGYPGWTPNTHSALMEVTKKAYIDLFNKEPQVLAIHAGLECGLFLLKYPYLDMVSIGPQMYGVHSPQERLSIPSTDNCYLWLCHTLELL